MRLAMVALLAMGGVAGSSVVRTQVARPLEVNRVDGLAAAATASYLSGTATFLPARRVDGIQVSGAGGSDVLLARYDLTTGAAVWAKAYGDEADQYGRDSSAPTADGTVAMVGRVAPAGRLGQCASGPTVRCSGVVVANDNANEIDFVLLVDAGTGGVKSGTQVVDNGITGQLNAVAVNGALDLVAVCGTVSATSSLCQGTTPSSCAASTAFRGGSSDLLVALLDSKGKLRWTRQVGGTPGVRADESCNAVAIASDGSVWAAGKYMERLDLGTGPLPALPNLNSTRHMWLAHFGPDGSTLAAQAFGTLVPSPSGNVTPYDLEIDAAGNLVVGGSFTSSFPVGGLVSAGGTDAFTAKIAPSLTGVWGARLGNTGTDLAQAVTIARGDDVLVTGSYAAVTTGMATTGAASLAAPPGAVGQAFLLRLDGATGGTLAAAGYGDASVQSGTEVVTSGDRVQWAGTFLGTLDLGEKTTPLVNSGVTLQGFTAFGDVR